MFFWPLKCLSCVAIPAYVYYFALWRYTDYSLSTINLWVSTWNLKPAVYIYYTRWTDHCETLLKCSVNCVSIGLFSSLCSLAQYSISHTCRIMHNTHDNSQLLYTHDNVEKSGSHRQKMKHSSCTFFR